MTSCDEKDLPGLSDDFWSDLSKSLGLNKALEQTDKTTQVVDKASGSIDNMNTTVNRVLNEATTTWDKAKPYVIFFAGSLTALIVVTTLKNTKELVKK